MVCLEIPGNIDRGIEGSDSEEEAASKTDSHLKIKRMVTKGETWGAGDWDQRIHTTIYKIGN